MPPLRIMAHWPPSLRRRTADDELHEPGGDRPDAPDAQHGGDAGGDGDAQADGGEQAERHVEVQADGGRAVFEDRKSTTAAATSNSG